MDQPMLRNCRSSRLSNLGRSTAVAALVVGLHLCPPRALAHEDASKEGLWEREQLTGNWGGERSRLEDKGLQLGVNYTGETLGNVSGGVARSGIYEGRLEFFLNVDLGKAVGWEGGTVRANAYQIHGRGLSANYLGNNLMAASNIEAARSTRLFGLWFQQELWEGLISLRGGQIAADDEFFVSVYGANLLNASFGWPAILAADLPSGGPAYPLATPGARIKIAPTKELSVAAALLDGDPAGPGVGNPQLRDQNGTRFRTSDSPFVIAEAAWASNQDKDASGLPATYKVGAWHHSARFADQRVDTRGGSLASPTNSGPALRRGNYGIYLILDQMLWRDPGTEDSGPGVFLRLAASPEDRNVISRYIDGGISYKGLVPSRVDDVSIIGFGLAQVGSHARGLDVDARTFAGINRPVRDKEILLEVSYKAQIAPWWTVQPDVQYIINPGGRVATPSDPAGVRPIPDALVFGVRTTIAF
ncbi:MAG: carbohydrate porin [Proteobacteria bacterium]|nr:carbohydrate porin [Pseudomonadota bacterium]